MIGPTDPLAASYRRCRRIARRCGTSYYWAAGLLPPSARRHVHAVYAFCRLADDIVDDPAEVPTEQRAAALDRLGARLLTDLAAGRSDHPVLAAVVESATACRLPEQLFVRFLAAMAMDLDRDRYASWADLLGYMDGSAAVIGEMMLPVLTERADEDLVAAARALGIAFQLTNFLRDVGEDLDRGRVYLPQEDLAAFGADPRLRRVTPAWRALMRFEIDRCRRLYAEADPGVGRLPSRSARCVGTARLLYARILDRIEAGDYDVFTRRARVPLPEKLGTAGRMAVGLRPAGEGSP